MQVGFSFACAAEPVGTRSEWVPNGATKGSRSPDSTGEAGSSVDSGSYRSEVPSDVMGPLSPS